MTSDQESLFYKIKTKRNKEGRSSRRVKWTWKYNNGIIKQSESKNKGQAKTISRRGNQIKRSCNCNVYIIPSQIHPWSYTSVEFGPIKQDSHLWRIQMLGKSYTTIPFSIKTNVIQAQEGESSNSHLNYTCCPHPIVHFSWIWPITFFIFLLNKYIYNVFTSNH